MSWTHLSSKIVKIRKPHNCIMCIDRHNPPSEMKYTVGVMDGEIQSSCSCGICEAYMTPEKWRDYDHEMPEGGLLEDDDYKEFREKFLSEQITNV